MPRPAIGDLLLAVGQVPRAGRNLTLSTGEVRVFTGAGAAYWVVAPMQATIVDFRR